MSQSNTTGKLATSMSVSRCTAKEEGGSQSATFIIIISKQFRRIPHNMNILQQLTISCIEVPFSVHRLPSLQESHSIWRSADAVCFDVDSTVIMDEAIDQLAAFCNKAEEVKRVTEQAMQGGMEFREALRIRLGIIQPSLSAVHAFASQHPSRLTTDISRLIDTLLKRGVDVYLVSGGFRILIEPVARQLGIPSENIFANQLIFNADGSYASFDETQMTSRSGGKGDVLSYLKKSRGYKRMVMIGDGATDMEACPPADAFIGFGGNVIRESVRSRATWFVYDFKSLINMLK